MGNTDKFDAIAQLYDTPERVRIAKRASDAIREYLGNAKNKRAIDFGCGTGLVGMNLIDDFKSILFLDSSQKMIDQVRQKIADLDVRNADTRCFDFEKEEQADMRADTIFMVQVLLHIQAYEVVLSKLFDVLNSEGHLLIIDFVKNEDIQSDTIHNGFDLKQLEEIITKIGYRDVQTKTIYTGSNLLLGHDASLFILDAKKPAPGM